ncbi:unnamed protein product [Rotaria sordida]|uniref:Uncharacterized protein n=1 Tax=Rotaria sordida TaxID=392033 RepID=A0A814UZE8_9BILA|nr:unnamed protein product [Rotaria sordida]
MINDNWRLTDGYHPTSIDYDHTLNTSAGHYIFYQSLIIDPQFKYSEIKAGKPTEIGDNPPNYDFTYGNQSGDYA